MTGLLWVFSCKKKLKCLTADKQKFDIAGGHGITQTIFSDNKSRLENESQVSIKNVQFYFLCNDIMVHVYLLTATLISSIFEKLIDNILSVMHCRFS